MEPEFLTLCRVFFGCRPLSLLSCQADRFLVTFYSGSAVLDYNDSISKELTIDRQTEILGMGAILYLTKKDLHHSFSHSLAVQR